MDYVATFGLAALTAIAVGAIWQRNRSEKREEQARDQHLLHSPGAKPAEESKEQAAPGTATRIRKFFVAVKPYATWRGVLLLLIIGELIHLMARYGAFPSIFGAGEPLPTPTEIGEWFWRNWILILAGFGGLLFVIHEFVGAPSPDKAKADQNQARSKRLEKSLMVLTVGGFLLYFVGPYLPNGQVGYGANVPKALSSPRCAMAVVGKTVSCTVDPSIVRRRLIDLPITKTRTHVCADHPKGDGGVVTRSGNTLVVTVTGNDIVTVYIKILPSPTSPCPTLGPSDI